MFLLFTRDTSSLAVHCFILLFMMLDTWSFPYSSMTLVGPPLLNCLIKTQGIWLLLDAFCRSLVARFLN